MPIIHVMDELIDTAISKKDYLRAIALELYEIVSELRLIRGELEKRSR